ncbi:MAG: single-stranded DNA-binding protein [Treponema sp.]|uniref:single-stranded DNA-binding protein n=1 Tax=Treponema sp. TaxID=166 RepID=UPI0025F2B5D8|nr:single-stranded DNA-binding protein [Treponema sp.]MBQ8679171.1 single-stranded DNA-binding protein [Treponema sp.]
MNQLNQIIIEGNLVRDSEIRETARGSTVAKFTLAVNRYVKNAAGEFEQETYFFDAEAWGKLAETVEKKAKKGTGCRLVGRLKQDRWKGSDGKTYSKVYIMSEQIDFTAKSEKSENEEDSTQKNESAEPPAQEKAQTRRKPKFDKESLFGNHNATEEEQPKAAGFDIY